jgi:hypothetical protein
MSPPAMLEVNTFSIGISTHDIANTPCIIKSDFSHLSDFVIGTIVIPIINVDIAIMP